jgi:hypothetical protein
MREIRTAIEINASPEKVWQIITGFEAFPDWNPFIKRISGDASVGGRLDVFLQPPDANGMGFKPTVLKSDTASEFRWKGRVMMPGVFDGEHYFIIEPLQENRVRFIHGEKFSGILVPLFGGTITKAKRGFEEMNEALKKRAEQSSA